ncbi:acyltransferase family protein [Vagococcus fluvialis]|uniref:acyltransferase family protein n=1 Tax=Vagococcus fluvialis TaxID=2738 RepID=UPI003B5A1C92
MKVRVDWVDISKLFGMFFIYLGHLGSKSGLAYPWVYTFHVPLFFFLSGCLENYNKKNLSNNFKSKIISLLIPFYFFSILVSLLVAVNTNSTDIIKRFVSIWINGGIRNTLPVGTGLWFLTCLFIIEVLFSIIKKLKNKILIVIVCLMFYIYAVYFINPSPITNPHWIWNIDSAFYYLIFYCIGWISFNHLNKLFDSESNKGRIVIFVLTFLSFVYSGLLFFNKNIFLITNISTSYFKLITDLLTPLVTIFLVISISNYLRNFEYLKKMGKNSLYLCGSEYLIKVLLTTSLSLVGVTINLSTPLSYFIYAVFLLVLVNHLLVPFEKRLLGKIQMSLKKYL